MCVYTVLCVYGQTDEREFLLSLSGLLFLTFVDNYVHTPCTYSSACVCVKGKPPRGAFRCDAGGAKKEEEEEEASLLLLSSMETGFSVDD